MNTILILLSIYSVSSLITSLISLIERRKLIKVFTDKDQTFNNKQILEIAIFVLNPLRKENKKQLERSILDTQKMMSLMDKIKNNKLLELDDIKYLSDVRYRLKLKLDDLIRLDSAYIFINLLIIISIIYLN